jgi:cob(I)alamin adenosyltransferase
MGNRLSKIATRTGDSGMTGLGDGSRVEKDHLRICAMGDVDELNSEIGVLMTEEIPASIAPELQELFLQIQHDLFDLGGELCIPNYKLLNPEHVAQLDVWLEKYNKQLPLNLFCLEEHGQQRKLMFAEQFVDELNVQLCAWVGLSLCMTLLVSMSIASQICYLF